MEKPNLNIGNQEFQRVGEMKSEETGSMYAPESFNLYQDTQDGALMGELPKDHPVEKILNFKIETMQSRFGETYKKIQEVDEMKNPEVLSEKHIIDCDADPICPRIGWEINHKALWEVEEHQKGGQLEFDPKGIELLWISVDRRGNGTDGNDVREELKNKPVLNANVLDYLLAHENLIPKVWKEISKNLGGVSFWGTIYKDGERLAVRNLQWDKSGDIHYKPGRWVSGLEIINGGELNRSANGELHRSMRNWRPFAVRAS